MTKVITPTVGRKVWYRHDGYSATGIDGGLVYPVSYGNQPMDATVIYVWGDRTVNLSITDHAGNTFALSSVTLVQEGDATPGGRYCEWMPYQRGQAKKDDDQPQVGSGTFSLDSTTPLTPATSCQADDTTCEACQ